MVVSQNRFGRLDLRLPHENLYSCEPTDAQSICGGGGFIGKHGLYALRFEHTAQDLGFKLAGYCGHNAEIGMHNENLTCM